MKQSVTLSRSQTERVCVCVSYALAPCVCGNSEVADGIAEVAGLQLPASQWVRSLKFIIINTTTNPPKVSSLFLCF